MTRKKWIIHRAKSRRYKKRVWKQRHKRGNHLRKNYGATYEIKRVFGKPGRKTQLLILREDLEENLQVPDIPEQRKLELEKRREEINQQLKRIQGRPPTEPVRGEKQLDLKLGFLERFKGTSSRRPEFVERLNLPLKEKIPILKEEARRKAKEHFGVRKGLGILSEKSLAEVVKGKEPSQISLRDLKKYKRLNFGSAYFENPEERKKLDKKLDNLANDVLSAKEGIPQKRSYFEGYTEALKDLDLLIPAQYDKQDFKFTRLKRRFGQPEKTK